MTVVAIAYIATGAVLLAIPFAAARIVGIMSLLALPIFLVGHSDSQH